MPCASCGDGTGNENINPLDTCTNGFMSCGNPCAADPVNTAANETLPSQIDNFTTQFFGEVIKTEINGAVVWSLPCSLDVGLPSNPRGETEPLACYFLRLFQDGVVGTPGADGLPGAIGADGRNAYTVLTSNFNQPQLSNPQLLIRTIFNTAIQPGMHIFIDTSGWYRVDAAVPDGTLFVTFLASITSPQSVITKGRLVLPAGAQGLSTPGAQGQHGAKGVTGDKGAKGDTGAPGLPGLPAPVSGVTGTNGQYHDDSGVLFVAPNSGPAWVEVDFGTTKPFVTLPDIGTYLLTAVTSIYSHTGGVDFKVRLYDVTVAAAVPGTEQFTTSTSPRTMSMSAVYTTVGVNQVVRLEAFGKLGKVYPVNTTLTFVRLS